MNDGSLCIGRGTGVHGIMEERAYMIPERPAK